MKTAIEQLMIALYEGGYLRGNGNEMDDILEKYKEMEKKQITDSYLIGLLHPIEMDATEQAEEYYNETYGSGAVGEKGGAVNKGSDDQVPDVRKMVKNNLLNECVYHNLCDRAMCPNKDVCVNCQSTSSQTEISDFEIDDAWQEFRTQNPNTIGGFQDQYVSFLYAIKWYREQLKQKQ